MAITLKAEKREKTGKYVAFDLRKAGKIPAVVYGKGLESNINLTLDQKEFKQVLASGSRLIDLDVAGHKQMAVVKAVQHETIGKNILHADFRAVDANTTLHLDVEVVLKGDAVGVQEGGIIEQNLHMITLECLPKDLPASIELDISGLKIGGVLLVKDIPALSGVKFVTHEDVPVVSCNYKSEDKPAAAAAAEPAADAAAAPAAAPAADAKKADAAKK